MQFKSLYIKSFGIFDERIPPGSRLFHFSQKGITLISGENEKGKTTLMEVLVDALYGISDERRKRRRPWGRHNQYGAVLELSVRGKDYRIERDFDTHFTEIVDINNGREIKLFSGNANPRGRGKSVVYYKKVLEEIGIPPRDAMAQLGFVSKLEMEKGISGEVRRIITGGGSNYNTVLDGLKEKLFEITMTDPWQTRNKNTQRRLESAIEQRENLRELREKTLQQRQEMLNLQEEAKELQYAIDKSSEEIEKTRILLKGLKDSFFIGQEDIALRREMGELVKKKSDIEGKKKALVSLNCQIQEKYGFFKRFPHDLEALCRELEIVRNELENSEKRIKQYDVKLKDLNNEKFILETKLKNNFSSLMRAGEDFVDYYKKFRELEQSYKNLYNVYKEKRQKVEELQSELAQWEHLEELPPNYDELLIRCWEDMGELMAQQRSIKSQIQEIHNLKEKERNIQKSLDGKFPPFHELGDNFEEKLRVFIAQLKIKKEKDEELQKINEEIHNLNKQVNHPRNFLYPALFSLILFILGFLLSNNSWTLGTILGLVGLILGGGMTYLLLREPWSKKVHLVATARILKQDLKSGIPNPGIPPDFPHGDNPVKLYDIYQDYKTARKNLDKVGYRLSQVSSVEELEQALQEINKQILEKDRILNLPPDTDIRPLIEEFRKFRKVQSSMEEMVNIMLDKFPSVAELKTLPTIPLELVEIQEEMEKILELYPLIPHFSDINILKSQIGEMSELKEKLSRVETRINHMIKEDEEHKQYDQLKDREREILEKLNPIIEKTGDDLRKIEALYREYQKISNAEQLQKKWVEESGDLKEILERLADLSGRGTALEQQRKKLFEEFPALVSLYDPNPEKASQRIKKFEDFLELRTQEITLKKERLNYCTLRLEHEMVRVPDPRQLTQEIDILSQDIENMIKLRDACKIAVDTLEESVVEFQSNYREILEKQISTIFIQLAGEKYAGVNLDKNFELVIQGNARERIEKEQLSSGTLDQLYLSIRIALAYGLSDQISIPFLLDDPFVYFDGNRLNTALGILTEISKKHQVILFTHAKDFESWCDNSYNLDDICGSPPTQYLYSAPQTQFLKMPSQAAKTAFLNPEDYKKWLE